MGEIGHHIDFMIPQNGVGLMVLNHCPYRLYYLRGLRPPVGKITNKNGFSPGVLPYPVNTAVIHLRQQGRQFAVVTMHIANDVVSDRPLVARVQFDICHSNQISCWGFNLQKKQIYFAIFAAK